MEMTLRDKLIFDKSNKLNNKTIKYLNLRMFFVFNDDIIFYYYHDLAANIKAGSL